LDRFHNRGDAGLGRAETELFELQLQLALELDLPVIVHSRDAAQETLEVLQRYPSVRGVIHCFSYGKDESRLFLDSGWYLSFAGNVTYKNAENLREALRFVSEDRLLLETDSPYLSPVPHRGKSATPQMVEVTYRFAAELRGLPVERLAESVRINGSKLFGFPTPP
jgi:TatD DNase family protein